MRLSFLVAVVGFERGEGPHEYCLGGLVCSFGDGTIIHCRDNIKDSLRIAWWHNPKGIMGSIIEIEATPDITPGMIKDVQFKRTRPDTNYPDYGVFFK